MIKRYTNLRLHYFTIVAVFKISLLTV